MARNHRTGLFLAALLAGCSSDTERPKESDTAIRPADLTVKVVPDWATYTDRGRFHVKIQFQSTSPAPIFILLPVDGSCDGRLMPYYQFTVHNADGQALRPSPYCGTLGLDSMKSRWPHEYLVEIKPGASFEMELPLYVEFQNDGSHAVSFEYVYQPINEWLDPPAKAWRGRVKADPVVLNLRRR